LLLLKLCEKWKSFFDFQGRLFPVFSTAFRLAIVFYFFHRKISRQNGLGTTIAGSVDPRHSLLCRLSTPSCFFIASLFAHRFAAHLDTVGVVHQAVH
jgi:hypothetical protein